MSKDIIISEEDARFAMEDRFPTSTELKILREKIQSQLPSYTRQEVLEFKYDPLNYPNTAYWYLDKNGIIHQVEAYDEASRALIFIRKNNGCIFVPTEDLIKECKTIWEGA